VRALIPGTTDHTIYLQHLPSHRVMICWAGLKALSLAAKMPESLSFLPPLHNSVPPTFWLIWSIPLDLNTCYTWEYKLRVCGTNRNLTTTGYKAPYSQQWFPLNKKEKLLIKQPRSGKLTLDWPQPQPTYSNSLYTRNYKRL
jgi:hypothetical protein